MPQIGHEPGASRTICGCIGMCIRLAVRTSPALVMVMRSIYSARISPVKSGTLQRSLGCRSEKMAPLYATLAAAFDGSTFIPQTGSNS